MSFISAIRPQDVEYAQENASRYGECASARRFYAYVENDPLNATDPSGNCPWCVVGFFVGGGADLAAQLYNNGGHLSQVDFVQTAGAAGVGAVTGGASAFIGGAIEGAGVVAIAGRAAANAALSSGATVGQTAVLNNFDGHNDSYTRSAVVGAGFGALGSALGDSVGAGIQALTPDPGYSAGQKGFAIYYGNLNNITPPAPLGTVIGQSVGAAVGGGSSFVPLENSPPGSGGNSH
jgi:hypothetical protein